MAQTVNVPGIGQLNFPDGMSQPEMAEAIQRNFPQIHSQSQFGAPVTANGIPNDNPANLSEEQKNWAVNKQQPTEPESNWSAESLWNKLKGLVEAPASVLTSIPASVIGSAYGVAKTLSSGKYGTQEGIQIGDKSASDLASKLTYEPRTATGKAALSTISDAVDKSGVIGIPMLELEALSRASSGSGAALRNIGRDAPAVADVVPSEAVAAPINYDTPAYIRQGQAAPVEIVKPAQEMGAANTIRLANTESPGRAVTNRFDEFGSRIIPDEPVAAPVNSGADMIRMGNTEAPQNAVTNRYDASGNRIIPAEPVSAASADQISAVANDFTPYVSVENGALNKDLMLGPSDPATRAQVLQDVGITSARDSAIAADPLKASIQYQIGKFDEPAGRAAIAQFEHEKTALENYVSDKIPGVKGAIALDEQSLQNKGQVIAAPYDAARVYFEAAKKNLYDIANQRAEESGVPIKTNSVDQLLADPDFKATLMAKDQQGLLNTIQSQYDRFKALDNGNMSVANAELYRKWLNKVWSPDKSETLGMVKGALDNDVFRSAGEDVYSAGRQMHQLEKRTLDDPNGISKIMDSDPYTPINRTTPYNKIPDAVLNLSPDQFKHIIDTYKQLPDQLQPMAQQAIATLKAHFGDRILKEGATVKGIKGREIWNNGAVNSLLNNNSSKLPLLFDTADERAAINNVRDAGNINSINTAYPGAAAQLDLARKQGLMSRSIGRATAVASGGAGAVVGGPIGAGIGAGVGDAIGGSIARHFGETRAHKEFMGGIVGVDDYLAKSNAIKQEATAQQLQIDKKIQLQEKLQAFSRAAKSALPVAYLDAGASQNTQNKSTIPMVNVLLDPRPTQDIINWALSPSIGTGLINSNQQ